MHESANHRGIMHLHQATYQSFPQGKPNPYMPPAQFGAYVSWTCSIIQRDRSSK